jgi:cell division protein ZapB
MNLSEQEQDLARLEQRVDELINTCRRLRDENLSLRSSRDLLLEEKSKLAEKNKIARNRLETIVDRLRTLENIK